MEKSFLSGHNVSQRYLNFRQEFLQAECVCAIRPLLPTINISERKPTGGW